MSNVSKYLFVSIAIVTLGIAQPLVVQDQQTGPDSVTFALANPRSVAVTAFAVSLVVRFSDGYETALTDLLDGYQANEPPIAAGGTRDMHFPLPTHDSAQVTSAAVSVDATIYDDGGASGNPTKIANIVRVRKQDARQIQHTLDRLQKARASSDPVATLASLADVPSNDSRIKAHQKDYTTITAALKSAKSQDQMRKALDGIIEIVQTRLARAQRASEVTQ